MTLRIWNGAVDHRPAFVVRCTTAADVRAGLDKAASAGVGVSVLGGGHDWLGRSVRTGALVLDLSGMRDVRIVDDVAVIGGGATLLDVATAATKAGRLVATGTVGSVGVGGYTLGGGYGPYCGFAGLGADNLVAAEVVLGDGTIVHTSETEEPDLLWALRGGGGNFGVVTELHVRTHPIASVLAGTVVYGWDEAARVLAGFDDLARSFPDELTSTVALFTLPGGDRVVALSPVWAGDHNEGQSWMGRLQSLGSPVMSDIRPSTVPDLLRAGDAMFAEPVLNWDLATRSVATLTSEVIATLVTGVEAMTSPLSAVNMHHFHGAATRVPRESAAHAERRPHFMLELISSWRAGERADLAWKTQVHDKLGSVALPGGYPNLVSPDQTDQVELMYGPSPHRLLDLKRRYDPAGTFIATPLPF